MELPDFFRLHFPDQSFSRSGQDNGLKSGKAEELKPQINIFFLILILI
jgi:hypothetical protein